MTASLITKTFEQKTVGTYRGKHSATTVAAEFYFREDGWFNMTKAAKAFGKVPNEFLRLPSTIEYLQAVESHGKIPTLFTTQGGWHLNPDVGTWAHPKLAVFFARWLDVRFAVWCDAVIEDILKGNTPAPAVAPNPAHMLTHEAFAMFTQAVRDEMASMGAAIRELKERPALARPSMIQPPSLQAKPKDALMTIDAFFDEVKPEVQAYRRSRFASTEEYLEALYEKFPHKTFVGFIRGGGLRPEVGTWAHPKLAIAFARGLDMRFNHARALSVAG
ncbi:MAG: KilA-N domain-containing protein [Aquabacterium sp.]